jgi:hypothetical protein
LKKFSCVIRPRFNQMNMIESAALFVIAQENLSVERRVRVTRVVSIDGPTTVSFPQGVTRDQVKSCAWDVAPAGEAGNLQRQGIRERMRVHTIDPNDIVKVRDVLATVRPFEVYNLSGLSSVALSFTQPRETFDSHAGAGGNPRRRARLPLLPRLLERDIW